MNLHTARIVVGLFITHNKKQLASIAKYSGKKPMDMLKEAYIKMGNSKPITAYKDNHGNIIPIGRQAPEKPKFGWINTGSKGKPRWEKSSDPQQGVFDKYYSKIDEMQANAFGKDDVEIVID
tara:strand:- start:9089 stop:9454 length:366 start_codon:yes stop_codon:yes gene_type:complete